MPSICSSSGDAPMQDRHRILIVEDDARLAELTRDYLESQGLEVSLQADGRRAVNQILAERPALVVLDLMLPGESGFSVCRRVREQGYDGPILLLTARTDDLDQEPGVEMGADGHVCKPVRAGVLVVPSRA